MKKFFAFMLCFSLVCGMLSAGLVGCTGEKKAVTPAKDAPAKDAPAKDAPAKDAPKK